MNINEIQYSNSFWFNNYLSDCDLSYKYKLKSKYKKPVLSEIKLDLNLQNVLLSENKQTNKSHVLIKTYAFLYTIFLVNPKISSSIKSTSQDLNETEDNSLHLKLIFLNQKQKDSFLFFYFIELWSKILKSKYKLQIKAPSLFQLSSTKVILYSNILLHDFNTFSNFYAFTGSSLFSDPILGVKFIFKNLNSNFIQKGIKNLPFFWQVK